MSEAVFDVTERLKWMLEEKSNQHESETIKGAIQLLDYRKRENNELKLENKKLHKQLMEIQREYQRLNSYKSVQVLKLTEKCKCWEIEAKKMAAELGEKKIKKALKKGKKKA